MTLYFQGKDEFMGRCVESPVVKLKGQGPPAPRLLWEPVKKGREDAGEILVALELFLVRSGAKTVSQSDTVSEVHLQAKWAIRPAAYLLCPQHKVTRSI